MQRPRVRRTPHRYVLFRGLNSSAIEHVESPVVEHHRPRIARPTPSPRTPVYSERSARASDTATASTKAANPGHGHAADQDTFYNRAL
jgi:hypothetical protein